MSATTIRRVVLLEGVSDVAAVRALASSHGVDLTSVRLVDLHGVTNVRRELEAVHRHEPDTIPMGLCDAAEAHFVQQALRGIGCVARDVSDLPSYGFFVCEQDLEDELIRALGTERAVEVVGRLGLGHKLDTLRQQPAWQRRPVTEQLHRFCGVASGRKELLAASLAAALSPGEAPEPIRLLLQQIAA